MEYLEKLLDQFSDTPQNIVLKADICRRGMKSTEDLAKAGAKTGQTGIATKLQKMILKMEELPPEKFHFKSDETTVDIRLNDNSPYEIHEDDQGKFHLYCGDQNFGEVRFPKPSHYTDKKTSSGEECTYLVSQRGPSCLCVSVMDMCAYLKKGEACKYCVFAFGVEVGVQQNVIKAIPDPKVLAEGYKIASKDIKVKELKVSGGGLYDTHKEASYHKRFLEALSEQTDLPEEVTIMPQALEKQDQKDLKALGATNICFNMEVWDEKLWPEILPGKSKAVGRDEWIKRLEDAVDVFGRGHVGSAFVGGIECAPRPGYLSQEEALKSYIEGFEFLIKRGIAPWFMIWNAHPLLGGFTVDDPPPTEFYLRLGQETHELMEKYGFYPDLGFPRMGVDPPTLGLYCYYCYNFSFTRDYPRLIGRE